MKIKKLLILTAAGLASSSVLANGSGMYTPAPAPMMTSDTGVYLEGLVGYNRYSFEDAVRFFDRFGDWKNGNGNWAFAADIGYQFHRYLSLEAGYIYTVKAKYTLQSPAALAGSVADLRPWYAYLAAKLSVMVYDNLSVFAKLGPGYQKVESKNLPINQQHLGDNKWGAMFGAGLTYNFTPAFYIVGEWLRFTGKIKINTLHDLTDLNDIILPAPNIFLIGLAYKFSM